MILKKSDLARVRTGLFRCPTCGTYYDPTYGACPGCKPSKATIVATLGIVIFLIWLPLRVQAQLAPPPCVVQGEVVQCNFVYLPVAH